MSADVQVAPAALENATAGKKGSKTKNLFRRSLGRRKSHASELVASPRSDDEQQNNAVSPKRKASVKAESQQQQITPEALEEAANAVAKKLKKKEKKKEKNAQRKSSRSSKRKKSLSKENPLALNQDQIQQAQQPKATAVSPSTSPRLEDSNLGLYTAANILGDPAPGYDDAIADMEKSIENADVRGELKHDPRAFTDGGNAYDQIAFQQEEDDEPESKSNYEDVTQIVESQKKQQKKKEKKRANSPINGAGDAYTEFDTKPPSGDLYDTLDLTSLQQDKKEAQKDKKKKTPKHTADELLPSLYSETDANGNSGFYATIDTTKSSSGKVQTRKTVDKDQEKIARKNSKTVVQSYESLNLGPKQDKKKPTTKTTSVSNPYVEVTSSLSQKKPITTSNTKKHLEVVPRGTLKLSKPGNKNDLEEMLSKTTPDMLKRILMEHSVDYRAKNLAFVMDSIKKETATRNQRLARSGDQFLGVREWNNELREILAFGPTAIGAKDTQTLATLGYDFVRSAETYAKVIINELSLDYDQKTIKPANIGGIAGGEKFIVGSILFKFCLDQLLVTGTQSVWMYGGATRNDENAMKTGGLELQGLSSWFSQLIPGLSFPLMAMIDYKGFRIIATSLLPINKTTIKYGSADGGRTVLAADPLLNTLMDNAAAGMNLKKHNVGAKRVPISGPGDIEGHHGTDGAYYVLDFARTFPPAAPDFDEHGLPKEPRAVFYKMLRPELVKTNPVPLSSDVFTGWGNYDDNRKQSQREVQDATDRILKDCIPDLVQELEKLDIITVSENYFATMRGGNSRSIHKLLCLINITGRMHSKGINVRYLGHVRAHMKAPSWRVLLNSIAVARLFKNKLRAKLRTVVRSTIASESTCRQLIADFINTLLFGQLMRGQDWMPNSARGLSDSWKNVNIREDLEAKFPGILSDKEKAQSFEVWMSSALCPRLVVCECLHMGILRLTESATKRLFKTTDFGAMHLAEEDIEEIAATVRHTHNINLYRALSAQNRATAVLERKSMLAFAKEALKKSIVATTKEQAHERVIEFANKSQADPLAANFEEDGQRCPAMARKLPLAQVEALLRERLDGVQRLIAEAESGAFPDTSAKSETEMPGTAYYNKFLQGADYIGESGHEQEQQPETPKSSAPIPEHDPAPECKISRSASMSEEEKIAECLRAAQKCPIKVRVHRARARHAAALLKDAQDLMSEAMKSASRDPYGVLLWADILKDLATTYEDPKKIDKAFARCYEKLDLSETYLGYPFKLSYWVRCEALLRHAASFIIRSPRDIDKAKEFCEKAAEILVTANMTDHISPCFSDAHLTTFVTREVDDEEMDQMMEASAD